MKQSFSVYLGVAVLLSIGRVLWGREADEVEPLPIGNFSVPPVTQLGPLISFGQTLIGKQAFSPELSGSYVQGHDSYSSDLTPTITYGILDELAVYLEVPFDVRSRSGSAHSSGIEDVLLQLEYGFYSRSRSDYVFETTVLGNVQFPSGSISKDPRTGNGSFSYFLGTTAAYMSANWYAFVSPGANLTTTRHGTKIGNSYLYQWGFARYVKALSPPGWVFDFMVEFDGVYAEKDKINRRRDPNSGGNTIFVTPSIGLFSKHWIIQWGIGFPILQDLNGKQDKATYLTAFDVGLGFQF